MRRRWIALLLIGVATSGPSARAGECVQAAAESERRNNLPTGLLAAIGQVESGGWSWSVNGNDGMPGHRFETVEAAVRYAGTLIGSGRRMVDLGCFQVDLLYHPDAFTSWQDAFDSHRNADAAADILNRLYRRTGDWRQAVALYHSADPASGQSYLRSVLTAWTGAGSAPFSPPLLPSFDPYVIVSSSSASMPVVWTPGTADRGRAASAGHADAGLPRVVTP